MKFLTNALFDALLERGEQLPIDHCGHHWRGQGLRRDALELLGPAASAGESRQTGDGPRLTALGLFAAREALLSGRLLDLKDWVRLRLQSAQCLACGRGVEYVFDGRSLRSTTDCDLVDDRFFQQLDVPSGALLVGQNLHFHLLGSARPPWGQLEESARGERHRESLFARRAVSAMYAVRGPLIRVRVGLRSDALSLYADDDRWTLSFDHPPRDGVVDRGRYQMNWSSALVDVMDASLARSAARPSAPGPTRIEVPCGRYRFELCAYDRAELDSTVAHASVLKFERHTPNE